MNRDPTPVLYVACADELPEIRAAWDRLEAVVPLKGRRFFARERLRGEPPEVYDGIAAAAEGPRDPSRPIIEHYRRRDEIDVLRPV